MTIAFPAAFDDDRSISYCDDNVSELGAEILNSLRDAVFSIESNIGLGAQGTAATIADRLAVSLDGSGAILPAALTGIGLVSLPITGSMVGASTIPESCLILTYGTAALNSAIASATSSISALVTALASTNTLFSNHTIGVAGADGYQYNHVLSHIKINDGANNGYQPRYTGIDYRDSSYNNPGIYGLDGYVRQVSQALAALIAINNDFLDHAHSLSAYKHTADFITVDNSAFNFIPATATTVQTAIEFLDSAQTIVLTDHDLSMHSSGVPRHSHAWVTSDGYAEHWGPYTVTTDNRPNGDCVVTFAPPSNELDWAFQQLLPGDHVRLNYSGFEINYPIERINYQTSSTYEIFLDGYNIIETNAALAILEKSHFDDNYFGKLAVVPANNSFNIDPATGNLSWAGRSFSPGSAIVVNPNGAQICGIDGCLDELDSAHYLLYVALYPTGNPADAVLNPISEITPIDVTGNLGTTPGAYTVQGIIDTLNKAFRSGGVNGRLAAFSYNGQIGIAIPDNYDNLGFSIVSGTTPISAGSYTNNIVSLTSPYRDPFGFGPLKGNFASSAYSASNVDVTKVFVGKKNKPFTVDGDFRSDLKAGYGTLSGSYYAANFVSSADVGSARYRGSYRVNAALSNTRLIPGATITILPTLSRVATGFDDNDYGRMIVEAVDTGCDGYTRIQTISCNTLTGSITRGSNPDETDPTTWVPVKLYFDEGSVNVPTYGSPEKNLFETYITKGGNTFAHRRAKLPVQSASATLLDTTLGQGSYAINSVYDFHNYGWNVVGVSPKLQGFYISGSTLLNKYVRFVVTAYDTTIDVFTGYICQPDTTTGILLNPGPTVRVRKGEVGRFYDRTGVDYIEIVFDEHVNYAIGDPTANRFVDIEIFPTLRTNDEYLCLGSFVQLYNNQASLLSRFVDLRNFGTTSEKHLSTTAISFIESGSRLLHGNGVISGFEYVTYDLTNESMSFKGGTANVNGTIVNKNNFEVFLFNLYTSSPSNVEFALCLKQDGTHELLPISTASSMTTFNYDGSTSAAFRVYTIEDIVRDRKDLLPIYVIQIVGETSGLTMTVPPLDIRRFVTNNESNDELVLYGTSTISASTMPIGSFSSWDSVVNYINYFSGIQSTIVVRGTTTISTAVTFSAPVTIIGDKNNIVNCTVDGVSLNINSDTRIDGVNFVRKFGTDVAAQKYTTAVSKATIGLLIGDYFGTTAATYENIIIENCTFSTEAPYRKSGAAHILFQQSGDNAYICNVSVRNNRFTEELSQLTIAFVNRNGASIISNPTAQGTVLSGVTVEGNKGNNLSWMLFSSDNESLNSRGLSAYGLNIVRNNIDYIWTNVSRYYMHGYDGTATPAVINSAVPPLHSDFVISNNTFTGISTKSISGTQILTTSVRVASPSTTISDNKCSSIDTICNGGVSSTATAPGELNIHDNIISSSVYGAEYFSPTDNPIATAEAAPYTAPFYSAIYVDGNVLSATSNKKVRVNIHDNIITNNLTDLGITGFDYRFPIYCNVPAMICNNIIDKCFGQKNIFGGGIGIVLNCYYASVTSNTFVGKISDNIINRGSTTVTGYISISCDDEIKNIQIVDNVFDSSTVDGSDTEVIIFSANAYKGLVQRNTNQTFIVDAMPFTNPLAHVTNASAGPDYDLLKSVYGRTDGTDIYFTEILYQKAVGATRSAGYFITHIQPMEGAKPVSISMDVSFTSAPGTDLYEVRTYSQTIDGVDREFLPVQSSNYMPSEYVTTPPQGTRYTYTNFVTHVITLDAAFLARYVDTFSSDRSIPLFFAVVDPADDSMCTVNAADTLMIKNINVTYRY